MEAKRASSTGLTPIERYNHQLVLAGADRIADRGHETGGAVTHKKQLESLRNVRSEEKLEGDTRRALEIARSPDLVSRVVPPFSSFRVKVARNAVHVLRVG